MISYSTRPAKCDARIRYKHTFRFLWQGHCLLKRVLHASSTRTNFFLTCKTLSLSDRICQKYQMHEKKRAFFHPSHFRLAQHIFFSYFHTHLKLQAAFCIVEPSLLSPLVEFLVLTTRLHTRYCFKQNKKNCIRKNSKIRIIFIQDPPFAS
jgi:hypothetical protein